MPLTAGTAGHVNRGKTCSGARSPSTDTDQLPVKQARGISIDLGYAQLELPGGRRLALVDVQGDEHHEDRR